MTTILVADDSETILLLMRTRLELAGYEVETTVDGGTRLVLRLKEQYPWRSSPGQALLTLILFEFGDSR